MFKKVLGTLGVGTGASTYWIIGRIAIVGINGVGIVVSIPAVVVGVTGAVALGAVGYVAGDLIDKVLKD